MDTGREASLRQVIYWVLRRCLGHYYEEGKWSVTCELVISSGIVAKYLHIYTISEYNSAI